MQLAVRGSAPRFTPDGALWANVAPKVTAGPLMGAGLCHRDLSFTSNLVDSGPHPVLKVYDVDGALLGGNRITRCASDAVADTAWGGGFHAVMSDQSRAVVAASDGMRNVVTNSTAARLW